MLLGAGRRARLCHDLCIVPIRKTVFLLLAVASLAAGAENKTKPGELVVEPPTLINLGFEWVIDGDDNRNALVEVAYRKVGERQWKPALPLDRKSTRLNSSH